MQDLIKRIEAAEGPSRELDMDIHISLEGGNSIAMRDVRTIPHYTSSIDAAMTLVMEGWLWRMDSEGYALVESPCYEYYVRSSRCKTPAIALCAAALRAKMTKNEG